MRRRRAITLRQAEMSDCEAMSDMHSRAFGRGWSDVEFESLLVQSGTHAFVAEYRNPLGRRAPAGFILYRLAADEAEVLSVAVMADYRRRGIGKMLMEEALRHLYREGINIVHLEVDDANDAAINLYYGLEFRASGQRQGYYAQGRETPGSALVMQRQLR